MLFLRFLDLKSSTGNIALRRTAIQSSTYLNQTADLAVDGNKSRFSRTRCFKAPDEWLAVDLGGGHNISHVIVTNRRDHFCGNYIQYRLLRVLSLMSSLYVCSMVLSFFQRFFHWKQDAYVIAVSVSVCEPIFSRTTRHTELKYSALFRLYLWETIKIWFFSDNALGYKMIKNA